MRFLWPRSPMPLWLCLSFFAAILLITVPTPCLANAPGSGRLPVEKIRSLADTPREITQAVRIRGHLWRNQLQSNLQGQSSGQLELEVQIETFGGFHLYDDRLLFYTQRDALLGDREWDVEVSDKPRTVRFLDPVTKSLKNGFSGQSLFRLRAKTPILTLTKIPKDYSIPLIVQFQACNDKVCLLPVAIEVPVPLLEKSQQKSQWSGRAESLLQERLRDGSALVYLLLFLAGLITAFTPCVYPLYPITLGLFSRWSAGRANQSFVLAVSYCSGMTLTYATLGLISAASGAVFGSLTQTPTFLIGMGVLMALSALAFSGWITVPGSQWLAERFGRADASHGEGKSLLKAFGMGASLGLVASPCVGPMLVVVLAFLSQELSGGSSADNYLRGFLMLSAFGVGMSSPFLILGHFMLRLGHRPQWGRFTPIIKNLGTVLMLASSLYFLVPGIKILRLQNADSSVAKLFEVSKPEDYDPKRLAIVDFRADWCAACLELEHKTFATAAVADFIKVQNFQFISVDLTQQEHPWAQKYGVVSLPTVLILKKDGTKCEDLSLFEFEVAESFIERLKSALRQCQ